MPQFGFSFGVHAGHNQMANGAIARGADAEFAGVGAGKFQGLLGAFEVGVGQHGQHHGQIGCFDDRVVVIRCVVRQVLTVRLNRQGGRSA